MIGISAYAAKTLPPDARIPLHYGIGAYNNFVSRTTGLVMWPGAGIVIYVLLLVTSHLKSEVTLVILPIVLVLLIAAQVGAYRVARGGTTGRSG
jgi:hypothetical protein